ncbi:beta-xylosidase [Daldinia loculata]|nr:beta-xylosidase [Daldinia loculata]
MQHLAPLTCFLALLFSLGISAQNSTLWNPIITGFHPDPSCIFVPELDDTWFCASSSFLAFPGLPIHASRDLLPGMAFLPKATGGIYAPTLRFRGGIFYLMTTLVNNPYSSEAWSDPAHFSFPGFDPSPFWDNDGTSTTGGSSPEGPHIFKRDGWYYMLAAEGGTRENHMVTMARSHNLQGPFEPAPANPLLTAANNTSSYFQAVGHVDLFQDANGRWWTVALAEEGGWPVFTPVSGEVSGWTLPAEEIPEQGEGQLSDADDSVTFPPGSPLPIHFVRWRLPTARNYAVSPPGHWNTLALKSSVLNLTGFDGDYALGRGQTFVGRRMAHSLFRFRVDVDVDWASSLTKEEMEVGVSAIQDQAQHFDLGIVLLKPSQEDNTSSAPSEAYPLLDTHFAFSAGPAGKEAEIRVFGYCRGDELVPYYSGTLTSLVLGVYATSNGKHGERASETYVSNWQYMGLRQFRSQDVDDADREA